MAPSARSDRPIMTATLTAATPSSAFGQESGPRGTRPWPDPAEHSELQLIRTLFVEDQPADVELAVAALSRSGFAVQKDVVDEKEPFLERIRGNSYDVVIADYRLPQWSGLEAIQLLRQENIDTPVILCSGLLGDINAGECLKQGAADYVLKENLGRLPTSVRQALREKKLLDDNKRNQRELARSNRELEQFAYVASHDLQEPLRMIAAYTQILADRYRGKLDEKADKYIHYVVDGATRMQTLIDDLLALSLVGHKGIVKRDTDCAAAIETAKKNLEVAIKKSGAQVELGPMPFVEADPALLPQVFQNLIGNSIKFRGAEAPMIRIWAEKQRQEWTIAVADNGIGIAPEHSQAIFGAFKRLHTQAEYPGSGIGLSVCKKIIEQHEGRIWAEPAPGGGTVFKFTLPVAKPTPRVEQ